MHNWFIDKLKLDYRYSAITVRNYVIKNASRVLNPISGLAALRAAMTTSLH